MIEDVKVSTSVSSNGSIHVHIHESNKQVKELEAEVKRFKAKVERLEDEVKCVKDDEKIGLAFLKCLASSKMTMTIEQFVEMLESAKVYITKHKFLETLRNKGYLRHDSNGKNQPTSKSTELFVSKKNAKKSMVLMLTAKGVFHFYNIYVIKKK